MTELQGSVPKKENSEFLANIPCNIDAEDILIKNSDSPCGIAPTTKILVEKPERIAGIVPISILEPSLFPTSSLRISPRSNKADTASLVDKQKVLKTSSLSKETSNPNVPVKTFKKIDTKDKDVEMAASAETSSESEPESLNETTMFPEPIDTLQESAADNMVPTEQDMTGNMVPTELVVSQAAVNTEPIASSEFCLATMGDIIFDFLKSNSSISLASIVTYVETKARTEGFILQVQTPKKSFATVASTVASQANANTSMLSFAEIAQTAAQTPSQNSWSQVGSKRAHVSPKVPHKKWAERTDSQKRFAAPGTVKQLMPDLQIVHVRGFNVSTDNPVTVLRDLIRDDLKFDTNFIWNLSGRTHTQIVELTVVKTEVPALMRAFAENKFGLKMSTTYDPRRPDKVETESVALSNFKNRLNREILRVRRASQHVHQIHIVTRLRHVIRFLEAFRDGDSNDPSVTPEPIPYFIAAFEDVSVPSGQNDLERAMSC